MPFSEEHLALLKKQLELVNQLRDVVAAQQRALEQLGAIEENYENAPHRERDGADSDHEGEMADIHAAAAKAEGRQRHRGGATTEAEKAVKNVEYKPPTEEEERGFMAVKPWLGAMAPPSNWNWTESQARDAAPAGTLTLQQVHGYRVRGCRDNAVTVDENTILYPAAAVCVLHNTANREQKFFMKHDDDVLCLAYNSQKRIAASGEQGKNASIFVFSVDNMTEALAEFRGHKRGVMSVAISPDGSRLVSVGMDDDHTILVHDLVAKTLIASTKGDSNVILALSWNTTKNADPTKQFVSCGSKHIKFWTLSGGSIDSDKGLLGNKGEYQGFLSIAFTPENTLITTDGGHIYGFEDNKLKTVLEAHNGGCFTVQADPAANRIVTGGRDGFVNVWDRTTLKNVATFNFNKQDTCSGLNSVHSLYLDPNRPDIMLVGTITSSLYTLNLRTSAITNVMTGHFGDLSTKNSYGECWGLSTHPTENKFASCGEDGTVRIFDVKSRKQIARGDTTGQKGQSCAISPCGKFVAVGFQSGKIGIYSAVDLTELSLISTKGMSKRVQSIKFSPDGQWLVAGTADNVANLYKMQGDDPIFSATLRGNSSVILHVDFTKDSKYVQTCSQAYELLFYDTATGKQVTNSRSLADADWATFSSILGWSVQGIWPKEADGSDINCVNKSHDGKFLASAEDSGLVKVFQYPCVGSGLDKTGKLGRRPNCLSGLAHSEHVTAVEFTADDKYIISAGGADNCLMVWSFTH